MSAARLYAKGPAVHTTVKVDGTSVDLEDLMTLTAQGAVTLHTMTYQPTRSRTRWPT